MLEITNKQKGPINIMVRSKRKLRSFTTKSIPGIGSGHNIYLLEDELVTAYINDIEKKGLISTRQV